MRQQINITKNDEDIIPYLKKQPNISKYIINLIKQDIKKEINLNKEEIIKIVKEYCSNKCQNNTSEPDSEVINSIKNILNI